MTIEALIVLDVHNRDVVVNLAQKGISRINDFDWMSQVSKKNHDVKLKIASILLD